MKSKYRKKWSVVIVLNKKPIRMGSYVDKVEAARAYDRTALQYHGEFARTNFPKEDYL